MTLLTVIELWAAGMLVGAACYLAGYGIALRAGEAEMRKAVLDVNGGHLNWNGHYYVVEEVDMFGVRIEQ